MDTINTGSKMSFAPNRYMPGMQTLMPTVLLWLVLLMTRVGFVLGSYLFLFIDVTKI